MATVRATGGVPATAFPQSDVLAYDAGMKFVVVVCCFALGCAGTGQSSKAAEAAYLSQQLACVDAAKTIEDSHACRADVRKRWGR